MGKGEIAHNEQFLLFPLCFQLNQITASPFVHIFDIISLSAVKLEEPEIGISGKELMTLYSTVTSVGGPSKMLHEKEKKLATSTLAWLNWEKTLGLCSAGVGCIVVKQF